MWEIFSGLYATIVAAAKSGDNFWVSFAFGTIVIAFHAKNRLQMITPRGEEYDFVRLLTLPDIVGRDLFRRSYVIYTILLEIFFVFLCLLRPLAPNFVGPLPDFEGSTWPLGAALVVVGLLPSVTGVDQIELTLRRFALSASNIPDEFFRRITQLSQGELVAHLAKEPRYQAELKKYWKVYNLAIACGCPPDESNHVARRAIGCDLFASWTLDGGSIWSAEKYDRLKEIFDLLRPKARVLRRDLEGLISAASSSKVVNYVLEKSKIVKSSPSSDEQASAAIDLSSSVITDPSKFPEFSTTDVSVYSEFLDLWREKSEELYVSNRRLCGLFAILAMADRATARDYALKNKPGSTSDNVLREMFILLKKSRRYNIKPIYNACVISGVSGFIGCLVALNLYGVVVKSLGGTYGKNHGIFGEALITSMTIFTGFVLSGLLALFIRFSRIQSDEWVYFTGFLRFPIIQFKGIIVATSVVGIIIGWISTVLYSMDLNTARRLADLGSEVAQDIIAVCVIISMIYVSLAISLCILADYIDLNAEKSMRNRATTLSCCLMVTIISLICHTSTLSLDPSYHQTFWSNLTSFAGFTFPALFFFEVSLRAHTRDEEIVRQPLDDVEKLRDSAGI